VMAGCPGSASAWEGLGYDCREILQSPVETIAHTGCHLLAGTFDDWLNALLNELLNELSTILRAMAATPPAAPCRAWDNQVMILAVVVRSLLFCDQAVEQAVCGCSRMAAGPQSNPGRHRPLVVKLAEALIL